MREEGLGAGVFEAAGPRGKVGTIFECFERSLGVWIVIGDMRSAVGLGNLQIDQQGGHGLAAHAGATIGAGCSIPGAMCWMATVSAINYSASCEVSRRAIIQPTT